MCGRFAQAQTREEYLAYLADEAERDIAYDPEPIGRFNVAPGTKVLLLSERDAHHIPPQLMGAMQEGNGSLSDVEKAASRLGLSGEIINKKLSNIYHFYVKKTQGFLASLMI